MWKNQTPFSLFSARFSSLYCLSDAHLCTKVIVINGTVIFLLFLCFIFFLLFFFLFYLFFYNFYFILNIYFLASSFSPTGANCVKSTIEWWIRSLPFFIFFDKRSLGLCSGGSRGKSSPKKLENVKKWHFLLDFGAREQKKKSICKILEVPPSTPIKLEILEKLSV